MMRGDQGIVLSSGGANGAYEVGVLQALLSGRSPATQGRPIQPRVYVGSSIGALNSAFMVSREAEEGMVSAAQGLERLWLEQLASSRTAHENGAFRIRGNPLRLFDPRNFLADPLGLLTQFVQDNAFLGRDLVDRTAALLESDDAIEQRLIQAINLSSFISTDPLMKLIRRTISFAAIRRSQVALRIAATNWNMGQLQVFRNPDFTDKRGAQIVAASAAIPGFFSPVNVGAQPFVDAAVLGYAKLTPAIEVDDVDTLHLIYVDTDIENIPIGELRSTVNALYRMMVTMWAKQINTSIEAVARINQQIVDMQHALRTANVSEADASRIMSAAFPAASEFSKTRKRRSLTPLTLHRYHPHDDLFGPLGMLNLNRRRLEGLIERGYEDAVNHNCGDSGCVLVPAQLPVTADSSQLKR